jgi:maltokinase
VTPFGPDDGVTRDPGDEAGSALAGLVASYLARLPGAPETSSQPLHVLEVEEIAAGRPGVVDVVASVGERVVHLPLGLRAPGEESYFLPEGEDPMLGWLEDSHGSAVAFDATSDAQTVTMLLARVAGTEADVGRVRRIHRGHERVTLAIEDRLAFTVFTEVGQGPRPAVDVLLALDEVGFNHLAAPLAVWRRGGRELGLVQEYLAGASTGLDLALTSVRDLYASGGAPELAGGDFGAEAHRIGTMAARMHLALDEAFGRRQGDVRAWADAIESAVARVAPSLLERPDVVDLLAALRATPTVCHAIRSHGDFRLERVARTEQGWHVIDFTSAQRPSVVAGIVPSEDDARTTDIRLPPLYRSPLVDVADMLWSFGHIAATAAEERDPFGQEGLDELARSWSERNRRAFLAGYLGVAGITGLVPTGRDTVQVMTMAFELERVAQRLAATV